MHIGLIMAPPLAAMGSFLLQLKYPSTLKCNRDAFFPGLPPALHPGSGHCYKRTESFFNRELTQHASLACVTQITHSNGTK